MESSPSSVDPPGTSTTRKDDAAAVTTTASDCDMRETRPTVCERRRAAPAAPLLWTPMPPIPLPPLLLSVRFSRADRLDRRRLSTRLLYDAATFWSSLRGNIVRDVLLVRTDPAWTVVLVLVLVLSLLPHADGVSPPPPTRSSARPQTARTGNDRLNAADTAGLIRRERDSSELSGLDLFRRSSEGALASHQMLESSSPSSPSLLPPPTFRMFTPPPPLLFFVFLAAAAAAWATRSCAWATANTSDENRRGKPADRAAHRSRVLLVMSCSSDRLSSAVATAEESRAAKARRTASCC